VKLISNTLFILLFLCFTSQVKATELSWKQLKAQKSGTITIHYKSVQPFLIQNNDGSLKGLEYEMIVGFKSYLKNKYGLTLNIDWQPKSTFGNLLETIANNPEPGKIGLGIVSKTPERESLFDFSTPYYPDIQVLVSHPSIPTLSMGDFESLTNDFQAISVRGTTYEDRLLNLKSNYDLQFEINYVKMSDQILDKILNTEGSFGYIDLSNYIIKLNTNAAIKRQHILADYGAGYCIIFNKESDWAIPINEYLFSKEYETLKKKEIKKLFGEDVFELIETLSRGENEEVILLTKEKELLDKELLKSEQQSDRQSYITNMLLACVLLILIISYALYNRNRIKSKANEILTIHRNRIEEQNNLLSKRNDELTKLDEEKNNFISILSHDLRAPINNIKGLAGILKLDENINEKQLSMIDHIADESRRLNKMVTRILDIEKIEKKTESDYHKIDLQEILKKVVNNYKIQADDKKINIALSCKNGLFILGLEQYLFHIFENLLSNAIKFSPLGSSLSIGVNSDGDQHVINFKDAGPGLSKDDKDNMYKKFTRLSAKPTAGERSTGLGLSIVYKYTQLLNGKLSCSSEENNGSTFTVSLKAIYDNT
jgi:signal transduction histidine kinase